MSNLIRNSQNAFEPEVRKTYIGGTDAAAICGLSDYKTAYEIWLEKTSGVFPEVSESTQDLFDWGHLLEPVIAKRYADTLYEPTIINTTNEFIEDSVYRFICANIDAKLVPIFEPENDYILECKTASYSQFQQWINGVPLSYYCQAQWYLMVTGLNRLVFAILVMDSRKLETFEVIRDDAFISEIRTKCIDFWNNHVLTNTPPALTISDLNKVKPLPDSSILADKDELIIHAEIKELSAKIKDLEAQKEERVNLVKTKMGSNAAIYAPESDKPLFTWKAQSRESVDTKALKEKHPAIYEEVLKVSESRMFLIK